MAQADYERAEFQLRDEEKEEANERHWLESGWGAQARGRRRSSSNSRTGTVGDRRLEYLIAFNKAATARKPEILRILGDPDLELSTVSRLPRRGVDDSRPRDYANVRVGILSLSDMALVEKHFQTQPITVVYRGEERDAWLPTKAKPARSRSRSRSRPRTGGRR